MDCENTIVQAGLEIVIAGYCMPVDSIRSARINRRLYRVLSTKSRDVRLSRHNIAVRFFLTHIDKMNLDYVQFNRIIPAELKVTIIPSLSTFAWSELSSTHMNIRFVAKHANNLDWCEVCRNSSLSPRDLVEKFADRINWYAICQNTSVTTEFLSTYIDKLEWHALSENPSAAEFLMSHVDKIDWRQISKMRIYPWSLLKRMRI